MVGLETLVISITVSLLVLMEPCIRNQQLKINNEEELRRKRVKTVSVHFKENLNDSSIANIVNVKDHSRNNTIW